MEVGVEVGVGWKRIGQAPVRGVRLVRRQVDFGGRSGGRKSGCLAIGEEGARMPHLDVGVPLTSGHSEI